MKKILNILFCAFVLCTGFGGIAHSAVVEWSGGNFEEYKEMTEGIVPVVFYPSAGPFRMARPQYEQIAEQYDNVDLIFILADNYTALTNAEKGKQTALPFINFYVNGELIDQMPNTQVFSNTTTFESKMQQYYDMYGGSSGGSGGNSTPNTFDVSYNSGGGTGVAPSSPTTCTIGGTCNAPANTYTYANHIFTRWACTKSNGASCGTFLPGQSISDVTSTKNDTITLTAQWIDGVPLKTPTSKSYVDSKMNALQPNFSGLGNSKLMTYGTTDGAVGARDIVTELGTSTTANSVPTRGAINTALNTKQPTMNGTSGYVATNTGTPGVLGEKAVYGGVTKMADALVDAQTLNNAVINAVNSELIQVDAGWRINTVDNLTLLPIDE